MAVPCTIVGARAPSPMMARDTRESRSVSRSTPAGAGQNPRDGTLHRTAFSFQIGTHCAGSYSYPKLIVHPPALWHYFSYGRRVHIYVPELPGTAHAGGACGSSPRDRLYMAYYAWTARATPSERV